MNPNQLTIDILRAFGVDTKYVTQADIQLRPNKYPEVFVTMVPWPLGARGRQAEEHRPALPLGAHPRSSARTRARATAAGHCGNVQHGPTLHLCGHSAGRR